MTTAAASIPTIRSMPRTAIGVWSACVNVRRRRTQPCRSPPALRAAHESSSPFRCRQPTRTMEKKRITVLCTEDHRVVREGIALIINLQPDMEVVGSASSGEEAIALFLRHRPDVTLMDLQLGTMGGVDAIKAIRKLQPDARVVVLTMDPGDEDIYRALDAGASAYLLKDTLSDDLIRVIRDVH